jgi:hypothetical protein
MSGVRIRERVLDTTRAPRERGLSCALVGTMARPRGLLLAGSLANAAHAGAKTQTRRPIKGLPPGGLDPETVGLDSEATSWWTGSSPRGEAWRARCPFGREGDHLFVRETWATMLERDPATGEKLDHLTPRYDPAGWKRHVAYWASAPPFEWVDGDGFTTGKSCWKPSIHMPRWASRTLVKIADVRVQRLWDVTDAQIKAEGVGAWTKDGALYKYGPAEPGDAGAWDWRDMPHTPREAFMRLWDQAYPVGTAAWPCNPWVWAITFEKVEETP